MSSRVGLVSLAVGIFLIGAAGIAAMAIDPPTGAASAPTPGGMTVGTLAWLLCGVAGLATGLLALHRSGRTPSGSNTSRSEPATMSRDHATAS